MITCLNGADQFTDHVLIMWLSYTDDVPQEAIIKELRRQESCKLQAIIMDFSCDESCGTAGNFQVDEQAGITQLNWQ